jgi:SPP1 family predicted phage head-tail adaptor
MKPPVTPPEPFYLHSGFFRHFVEIEKFIRTPDGAGGNSLVWQPFASAWAALQPLNARTTRFHEKAGQQLTHRIYLRHRDDMEIGMRVRLGERRFLVLTVRDPDMTGRIIELEAVEGTRA